MNILPGNKKIPEDFVRKVFGEEIYGIIKDYSTGGVTGFKGSVSDSPQGPTAASKLTLAP